MNTDSVVAGAGQKTGFGLKFVALTVLDLLAGPPEGFLVQEQTEPGIDDGPESVPLNRAVVSLQQCGARSNAELAGLLGYVAEQTLLHIVAAESGDLSGDAVEDARHRVINLGVLVTRYPAAADVIQRALEHSAAEVLRNDVQIPAAAAELIGQHIVALKLPVVK